MSTTRCVDHDRNLAFDHCPDWTVRVESAEENRPAFVTVWSPSGPGGTPGALVGIALEWHEFQGVAEFADAKLHRESESKGFELRAHAAGRHPKAGLTAVTATCNAQVGGRTQRKEFLFLEVGPGVILSASSICPYASRSLWREGTRTIFSSLGLADPSRPAVTPTHDRFGVGLASGNSDVVQRLWFLLDLTSRNLVNAHGETWRKRGGLELSAAASFEARSYLLHELGMIITECGRPRATREAIQRPIVQAILGTGRSGEPLKLYLQREAHYSAIDSGKVSMMSPSRATAFLLLLSTSGTESTPMDLSRRSPRGFGGIECSVRDVKDHFGLSLAFRYSVGHLFQDGEDVDAFDSEDVDRRIGLGHEEAAKSMHRLA